MNTKTENLIRIDRTGDGRNVVSARELHTFLENGKQFADWIKNRIRQYGFVENEDFALASPNGEASHGGHNRVEYAITLDMAKELSMVERNEKGKIARKYFIACEKMLRGVSDQQQQVGKADAVLKALGIFKASLEVSTIMGRGQFISAGAANRLALKHTDIDVLEEMELVEDGDEPRDPRRVLH